MSDTFTLFDGSEYTVLERSSGPADKLVMRFRLPDGCASPPFHTHPECRETFEVEEGRFDVRLGEGWRTLSPGESVTVERDQPHTFGNSSGAETIVRDTHDPHHDFETYLRRIAALTHECRSTAPRSPATAIKAAMIFNDYPDLIRPADAVMRVAFPILGGAGKLLRLSTPAAT
ncbi:MAG: cupin domain-containing protein [Solirubrobacterales bacterium]